MDGLAQNLGALGMQSTCSTSGNRDNDASQALMVGQGHFKAHASEQHSLSSGPASWPPSDSEDLDSESEVVLLMYMGFQRALPHHDGVHYAIAETASVL